MDRWEDHGWDDGEKEWVSFESREVSMKGVISRGMSGICGNKLEVFLGDEVVNKIVANGMEMMDTKCKSWRWWVVVIEGGG